MSRRTSKRRKLEVTKKKVVIIGALGMDFHVFIRVFRDNEEYDVRAFTVAGEQNVGTVEEKERLFPAGLSGKLYPEGIRMIPETQLDSFVTEEKIDEVVFAYSDIAHEKLMHLGSRALAAGANYRLISPNFTQVQSTKPCIAICGVRTGVGKSQISRAVCRFMKGLGIRVVAIREPMPYGDLMDQVCMRFATMEDFDKYKCTVEEREEYEPYVEQGLVIYSGVDYEKIVREAEKEADVIIFDGGNNEISFYKPDLLFVGADCLRPGHEMKFHPGEVNARMADVLVINKVNSGKKEDIEAVTENLKKLNPKATIMHTNSVVTVQDPALIKGKRVVVVEDGPTTTHGDMAYGAGIVAAKAYGCEVVVPKPYLKGCYKGVYEEFPHLTNVIPAMGYSKQQLIDLEETLNGCPVDAVVNGSPARLERLVKCKLPIARVDYDIEYIGESIPNLLKAFAKKHKLDKC